MRTCRTGEIEGMQYNRIHASKVQYLGIMDCTINPYCNNLEMVIAHKLSVSQQCHAVKRKGKLPKTKIRRPSALLHTAKALEYRVQLWACILKL